MSTAGLGKRFERFIESLLTKSGVELTPATGDGFDFVGGTNMGTKAAVEAKLYSSGSVSPGLLRSAATAVAYAAQRRGISKSILATNVLVPAGIRQELLSGLGVIVYDYEILTELAANHLDLAEEWDRIIGEARVFRSDFHTDFKAGIQATDPFRDIDTPAPLSFNRAQLGPPPSPGESLAEEIEQTPSGPKSAGEFEKKCTEALKYVFAEDLTAWHAQPTSDSRLNRYDLIARISSDEDFWQCLVRDFRARYVIFEFKNYAEEIAQKEIYTTEKYLYPAAMRAAAIIISRHGADENAKSAARGALRKSGKLIINISISDLRSMLESRDRGESGTEVLVQYLDHMLTRIER